MRKQTVADYLVDEVYER